MTNSLMINDYRNFVDWKEDRETADEKDGHITEINLISLNLDLKM